MSNIDTEKPYLLSYELRPEYLYVNIKAGTINFEMARQYWNEILEIRERANTRLLLVEKNVRAELSSAEEYQIAKEITTIALQRVKLAICDRHVSTECLEFGEMVVTNRGLNTKSFRDAVAAEKWLLAT